MLLTRMLLTVFLLANAWTGPVHAMDIAPAEARALVKSGYILSFEKIASHALAIKPGDILETELEFKKDRYIYEVEVLDAKGNVWELKLDASTGELIKIELDN